MTGIGTSEQRWQGQCCHADNWTARQEQAAEGATRARVDKYSTQQEQMAEQKLPRGECGGVTFLKIYRRTSGVEVGHPLVRGWSG
jgi:hypothetical protein